MVLILLLGALIGAHRSGTSCACRSSAAWTASSASSSVLLRGLVLIGVFVILGQLLQLDGEPGGATRMLVPYGESVANGLRSLVGEAHVRPSQRRTAL